MKNILYLIDTTGPGGAETLFIDLNKHFTDESSASLAIIHGPGWVESKLLEHGIKHRIIKAKGSFNIKYLYHLIRLIKNNKIDLIHAHLFGSSVYGSLAGLFTHTPVISTFHGLVDVNTSDKYLKQKIAIVKKGSTIVAVSQKIKDYLVENTSLYDSDVLMIPNGIHLKGPVTTDNHRFREQYNIPDSSTIIGCLGNIRPAKDYETAINTIKLLLEKKQDVVLLIAGATNHDLYNFFLDLIKQYNLENNVQFIGFVDDPFEFLSNLDIYLMTSTTEGQPISLFQAMSTKLPIVGTKCGIEDVLVDGKTAWISPVKSHASLSENIISIINNPEKADIRAKKAQEFVNEYYNIDTMFENYDALYNRLIKK